VHQYRRASSIAHPAHTFPRSQHRVRGHVPMLGHRRSALLAGEPARTAPAAPTSRAPSLAADAAQAPTTALEHNPATFRRRLPPLQEHPSRLACEAQALLGAGFLRLAPDVASVRS
jgi:hypothetical protein